MTLRTYLSALLEQVNHIKYLENIKTQKPLIFYSTMKMAGKQSSTLWPSITTSFAIILVQVLVQGSCTCMNLTTDDTMTAIGHTLLDYAAAEEFPSQQVSIRFYNTYTY